MEPRSFSLDVPEAAIEDLHRRLERTRLPDRTPGPDWRYGTDPDWLSALIDYWRTGFDWRAEEAALNAFPQYKVALHGVDLHYIAVPGKGPAPMPLLLMHGWPGSVFEFLDILPLLADPGAHGGDPADAFTVIAPSLPGFGLSFDPGQKRLGPVEMAACFAELMTGVLGFDRFGAQGGDWGSYVGSSLALSHAERLTGLHLNFIPITPDPEPVDNATEEERRYAEEIEEWLNEEYAYAAIHATRPQTLAYAMTDSPAGLAAWIGEKFHAWTDHDGDVFKAVDRDRMLANISLYWFTGAIGSSFWPYYARHHGQVPLPEGATVKVPMGHSAFPREIRRPPRSIAERTYTDIRRWTPMERGGHFAALEQPAALAEELRAFFAPLRS